MALAPKLAVWAPLSAVEEGPPQTYNSTGRPPKGHLPPLLVQTDSRSQLAAARHE